MGQLFPSAGRELHGAEHGKGHGRDHHGDNAGDAEKVLADDIGDIGQAYAYRDLRQGQVEEVLDHRQGDPGREEAEDHAAEELRCENQDAVSQRQVGGLGEGFDQDGEECNGRRVVEGAFTGNQGGQAPRRAQVAENPDHRGRVRCCDHRTQEQTGDEANMGHGVQGQSPRPRW